MARELRESIRPGLVWSSVIRDAQLHGTLPLLACNLARHANDLVPPAELESLRNLYRAQAARNTLVFRTLLQASKHLYRAGIPAITIKGPMLAHRAYGDLSLRQFSDLDYLIRRTDSESIISTLSTAGYQHLRTGRNWRYLKFQSPEGFLLDMQWGLGPEWFRFPLDFSSLWNRADYNDLGGTSVLELPDNETLMLLCGHATKHCWSKLGWLVDLNEYVRRRGQFIDWDELIGAAERLGGLRMLLLGFVLVRDVLGGEMPAELGKRACSDRKVAELSRVAREKLAASGESLGGSEGAFSRKETEQFHLAARERFRDRLPYARHLMARRLDWKPGVQRLVRASKRLSGSAKG